MSPMNVFQLAQRLPLPRTLPQASCSQTLPSFPAPSQQVILRQSTSLLLPALLLAMVGHPAPLHPSHGEDGAIGCWYLKHLLQKPAKQWATRRTLLTHLDPQSVVFIQVAKKVASHSLEIYYLSQVLLLFVIARKSRRLTRWVEIWTVQYMHYLDLGNGC